MNADNGIVGWLIFAATFSLGIIFQIAVGYTARLVIRWLDSRQPRPAQGGVPMKVETRGQLIAERDRLRALNAEIDEALKRGIECADNVVMHWESGDLAGAVNRLEQWARQTRETRSRQKFVKDHEPLPGGIGKR